MVRNSGITPSSLLIHKNTLKEMIPTQEMKPIMDYCRKTVNLSCRVGKTYSFLKQNRKKSTVLNEIFFKLIKPGERV